jgi:hypothetical protein|tara:strand:+ start:316 stop:579 length:264 start_codon:yes stop_codon:yes gene_type:complete
MQTEKPQLAVVIKGYYDTKDNEAFGIYLLDTKKVYIIPCEKDILNEYESFDCLGDTINSFKDKGYKIKYDINENTNFDIKSNFPILT